MDLLQDIDVTPSTFVVQRSDHTRYEQVAQPRTDTRELDMVISTGNIRSLAWHIDQTGQQTFQREVPVEFPESPELADRDNEDRLALLSVKYANNTIELSREDRARLEILNEIADKKNPRYDLEDLKVLKKAMSLVEQLEQL